MVKGTDVSVQVGCTWMWYTWPHLLINISTKCRWIYHTWMLLHPWNLTWNLKRSPWKRRFLLETIIFRFHVRFRGSRVYLLYGHLPTGIRKNLWFVASPFYTVPCQSLAAQRWQLERALVRVSHFGWRREKNPPKKRDAIPKLQKWGCWFFLFFFSPGIYFDQTQAISFRSILIQNFWVVSGICSLTLFDQCGFGGKY